MLYALPFSVLYFISTIVFGVITPHGLRSLESVGFKIDHTSKTITLITKEKSFDILIQYATTEISKIGGHLEDDSNCTSGLLYYHLYLNEIATRKLIAVMPLQSQQAQVPFISNYEIIRAQFPTPVYLPPPL